MLYLIAFGACAIAMAGLELLWFRFVVGPVYYPVLRPVLAEKPNVAAASAFYMFYIPGILVLAVHPALAASDWHLASLYGALMGFFTFATYDLTNLATLKVWSLRIASIDMTWGAFLTASSATAGALAALKFVHQG